MSGEREIDGDISDEFRALLAGKEARPFESVPCPTCGLVGGFLRNDDGSLDPPCCIPCSRTNAPAAGLLAGTEPWSGDPIDMDVLARAAFDAFYAEGTHYSDLERAIWQQVATAVVEAMPPFVMFRLAGTAPADGGER